MQQFVVHFSFPVHSTHLFLFLRPVLESVQRLQEDDEAAGGHFRAGEEDLGQVRSAGEGKSVGDLQKSHLAAHKVKDCRLSLAGCVS